MSRRWIDLTIGVGVVLASFLFMKRMAEVTDVTAGDLRFIEKSSPNPDHSGATYHRHIPAGLDVYEINGPFFFGAAEKFKGRTSAGASMRRWPQQRPVCGVVDPDLNDVLYRTDGLGPGCQYV